MGEGFLGVPVLHVYWEGRSFGDGFLPLCFVHQLLNCSSIFMYSGDTGAGASAKALLASAPWIIIPSSAARA